MRMSMIVVIVWVLVVIIADEWTLIFRVLG